MSVRGVTTGRPAVKRETVSLCDMGDARNFSVGQVLTFTPRYPWWKRLWRWVTRYKPPMNVVSHVDEENGVITLVCPQASHPSRYRQWIRFWYRAKRLLWWKPWSLVHRVLPGECECKGCE